jgi:hypothetical protein
MHAIHTLCINIGTSLHQKMRHLQLVHQKVISTSDYICKLPSSRTLLGVKHPPIGHAKHVSGCTSDQKLSSHTLFDVKHPRIRNAKHVTLNLSNHVSIRMVAPPVSLFLQPASWLSLACTLCACPASLTTCNLTFVAGAGTMHASLNDMRKEKRRQKDFLTRAVFH